MGSFYFVSGCVTYEAHGTKKKNTFVFLLSLTRTNNLENVYKMIYMKGFSRVWELRGWRGLFNC